MAMSTAAASLAEELPVRKALGLFACTGFVALGLWLFLPADTPRNLSAQTGVDPSGPGEPGENQSRPSQGAVIANPAAADLARPLPSGQPADLGPIPAPAASIDTSGEATSTGVLKLRIRDQLARATQALERGDRAEALRLAEAAKRIAGSAELVFSRDETSPSQFLARIASPVPDTAAGQLADLIARARTAGENGKLAEALSLAAQADRLARQHKLVAAPGTPRPSLLVAAYEVKLLEQSTGLGKQPLAELIRVRVKDYMVVASKQEAAGRPAEALRLATVAGLMASHQKLTFAEGEMTPQALIARIEAAHPGVAQSIAF